MLFFFFLQFRQQQQQQQQALNTTDNNTTSHSPIWSFIPSSARPCKKFMFVCLMVSVVLSACVRALIVPWCRPVEECGAAAGQPVPQVYSCKGGGANRCKVPPLSCFSRNAEQRAQGAGGASLPSVCSPPVQGMCETHGDSRGVTHWELLCYSTSFTCHLSSSIPPSSLLWEWESGLFSHSANRASGS